MATSIDDVLQITDPSKFSIALSKLVAQSPRGFAESRPAERVAWCVSELEAEVNKGGFSLFFMNSAGILPLRRRTHSVESARTKRWHS